MWLSKKVMTTYNCSREGQKNNGKHKHIFMYAISSYFSLFFYFYFTNLFFIQIYFTSYEPQTLINILQWLNFMDTLRTGS